VIHKTPAPKLAILHFGNSQAPGSTRPANDEESPRSSFHLQPVCRKNPVQCPTVAI